MWVVGSSLRPPVVGMMVGCLSFQSSGYTGIVVPLCKPNMITVPKRRTSRKAMSRVSGYPAASTVMSGPTPWVISFTASIRSCLSGLMVWVAPNSLGILQAVVQQVDGDHIPRPLLGGKHGEREAYGPLAHDQDALPQ